MIRYDVIVYDQDGNQVKFETFTRLYFAKCAGRSIKNDHPNYMVILQATNDEEIIDDCVITLKGKRESW